MDQLLEEPEYEDIDEGVEDEEDYYNKLESLKES